MWSDTRKEKKNSKDYYEYSINLFLSTFLELHIMHVVSCHFYTDTLIKYIKFYIHTNTYKNIEDQIYIEKIEEYTVYAFVAK